MNRPFNIAFIHPDLGIGGAERLVVDAAVHLRTAGHRVVLFTAYHDKAHCFEETKDGRIDVQVCGQFIPLHLGQRLRVPCAIVRMHYLAGRVAMLRDRFDIIFCDLVPHAIAALRILTSAKIIFYCHFPDRLLATQLGRWYRWYRAPIDRLEEITIGMAHRVVVNSKFTADAFRRAFPGLRDCPLQVIYPGVNVTDYNHGDVLTGQIGEKISIMSIARYERSKNVRLAIESVALLRAHLSSEAFDRIQLIVAGGFDERMAEHRETIAELQALARQRGLETQVLFLRSVSGQELRARLATCLCVVHTAPHEHFGYVPIEAMAAGRPVVVVNCGGPAETVVEGATGFLRPPTPQAFADALARLISDPEAAFKMGRAACAHVRARFSRQAFGEKLERLFEEELANDDGGQR
ncbi:MAG: glycosyltransferase [Deltaproteobacteria bacterium]|nr:glycosyltransferase [Deltaproteobacteria bacterium]